MPLPPSTSTTETTLPDGTIRVVSPGHTVNICRLRAGCLLFVETGVETPGAWRIMMREIDREIAANGWVMSFIDMRAVSRVDTVCREAWDDFGKTRRKTIRAVTVLQRSRLIEMAMRVAALFMGGTFRILSNEREFLAAIRAEVPAFDSLPAATG